MTAAMRHQSTNAYLTKPAEYFQNPRTDILPLLPNFSENVLELGCGTGATLAWLKSTHRCENTYGIELFSEAAEIAARHYTNAGILDKTHLRFFTRQSTITLVEGSGVHITQVKRLPLDSTTKGKIANAATLTLLKEFLTLQYLIAAKKQ